MRARAAIIAAALVFVATFAALTVVVVAYSGVTVLTLVSALVLAIVAFGVLGALGRPPPEE